MGQNEALSIGITPWKETSNSSLRSPTGLGPTGKVSEILCVLRLKTEIRAYVTQQHLDLGGYTHAQS